MGDAPAITVEEFRVHCKEKMEAFYDATRWPGWRQRDKEWEAQRRQDREDQASIELSAELGREQNKEFYKAARGAYRRLYRSLYLRTGTECAWFDPTLTRLPHGYRTRDLSYYELHQEYLENAVTF